MKSTASLCIGLAGVLLCTATRAKATTYEVGPAQSYPSLGGVPWQSLMPGDRVNIHYQPGGYHELILLSRSGTAANHIVIHGVPDPVTGALPVIDGQNAVTAPGTPYRASIFNVLGVIVISRAAGTSYGYIPSWIDIENLHIQNADRTLQLTTATGVSTTYNSFATGIYVEFAQHLTVRGCEINGCENGFFCNSKNGSTNELSADILIEHCHIHDNGWPGDYGVHNLYTEALGMTLQYNLIGPLRAGGSGEQWKNRSAGTVARYNQWIMGPGPGTCWWLESAQGGQGVIDADPSYKTNLCYGNVIYNPPNSGGIVMIRFDALGVEGQPRNGTLHFYNNTVVNHANQLQRYSTYVFELPHHDEVLATGIHATLDCRNNIIANLPTTNGSAASLCSLILSDDSAYNFGSNWLSPGTTLFTLPYLKTNFYGTITGTNQFMFGNQLGQNIPGFVDLNAANFHLLSSSRAIDTAGPQSPAVAGTIYDVAQEYVYPTNYQPRVVNGLGPDLGAFEGVSTNYTGPTYTLSVSNGSGSGTYPPGWTVNLAANPAPLGQVFDQWTGAAVANILAASTSLTMPASNTTVIATYKTAPVVTLTVVNGTGSGSYPQGSNVTIVANAPMNGQVFALWTGAAVANPLATTTAVTMPGTNIIVTATYTNAPAAGSNVLANPIVFVTQVPMPVERNGNVSNTVLSVVSLFGNHLADPAHAGRGGDLWLLTASGGLVNLTRSAGFGHSGNQDSNSIAVRDPAVHWSGGKLAFSMVIGAPSGPGDTNQFFWQLYELTNLAAVIANTNTVPVIVKVPHQAPDYNNLSPCYGSDERILFTSDRPHNGAAYLYPTREEYKGNPTVTGTWSLDPATGDLRLLNHTPSGAFNPIVDSFGRLIETRWDHLVQDANAVDDRLRRATNGSVNFLSEAPNAPTQSTNLVENFPEPRNFDTNALAQLGVRGNTFNFFLPWMLPQSGGNEEILNHVGRHELQQVVGNSFTNDPNLIILTNSNNGPLYGKLSWNTNFFFNFLQIAEDPLRPGTYFGVDAADFSPVGGTHSAGQILTLTGPPWLNPTGMVATYITPRSTAAQNNFGLYRNPLPTSDGSLLAAFTPTSSSVNSGFDTNTGTSSFPSAAYRFRLMTLTTNGGAGFWTTNKFLTAGLTNLVYYWDGTQTVAHTNALWELQPVEVRARTNPPPWNPGVAGVEAQVFAEEGVDLSTFQADLAARGLALSISRNVTVRDAADKQQPYNLRVPGGAQTLGTNTGRIYDITHLQFLEADYLRGYTLGTTNLAPGRRVLATPMRDTNGFNYASTRTNAPPGGTELLSDGSQATLLPANRALTWQLTGTTNESLVKERYWITFRPGEVRTCANCHGINVQDQAGQVSPTNAPLALRQLLRLWRTNAANAYTLTVSNGSGGGAFGAGTILSLAANPPPPGSAFSGWTGVGLGNPGAITTSFIMPPSNAVVAATYTNVPRPVLSRVVLQPNGTVMLSGVASAGASVTVLSSTNLSTTNWTPIGTVPADGTGRFQTGDPTSTNHPQRYYRARQTIPP